MLFFSIEFIGILHPLAAEIKEGALLLVYFWFSL